MVKPKKRSGSATVAEPLLFYGFRKNLLLLSVNVLGLTPGFFINTGSRVCHVKPYRFLGSPQFLLTCAGLFVSVGFLVTIIIVKGQGGAAVFPGTAPGFYRKPTAEPVAEFFVRYQIEGGLYT
jgi:hypothetical protein